MMRRRFIVGLTLLLLFQVSSLTVSARQAVYPTFPHTVPAGDSADLINSIACANTSSSSDVINLTNSVYTLTAIYANDTGLPPIVTAATAVTLTINGGLNGDAVAEDSVTQLTTDQRGAGFARSKGGTVDIGAYEATVLQGDVNGDGVVNLTDFSILAATFGKTAGSPGYDARADLKRG